MDKDAGLEVRGAICRALSMHHFLDPGNLVSDCYPSGFNQCHSMSQATPKCKKTSRRWYIHASQVWKNQKPSKAHAQCRQNEMLAASAKAKEHGREQKCVAAIRVMDAFGLQVVGLEPIPSVEDRALFRTKCAEIIGTSQFAKRKKKPRNV